MKVAVLTANLGNFDTPVDPVKQEDINYTFHRFTDENFPPITGLTPRMQYRIAKMFGWQMFPGYDYYVWLDGTFTLARPDSLKFFIDKCRSYDMVLFKHPWRNTMKEEVDHIEEHLRDGKDYITSRYKNGLHKEQYADCMLHQPDGFEDDRLYTSTAFVYEDNNEVREMMKLWWANTTRYFTCDQIALPFCVWNKDLDVNVIKDNQYKFKHLKMVSEHK